MREMITFPGQQATFHFRVAAVAFDPAGERVLIHRAVTDPHWTMPGGRVELMESAADAIKREMQEELNVRAEVERLLWVVENFFQYAGKQWHELAFYFLVSFPPGSPIYAQRKQFSGFEEGIELIFEWHDVGMIEQVNLLPSFLGSALRSLPASIQYVVHWDR
jgi:ADP-ribose pyrophosphatase YjhB (NUDIX family)